MNTYFAWRVYYRFRVLILLTVFSSNFFPEFSAHASYPELFGAGPRTLGIGQQSDGLAENAENGYYAPSLAAFSDQLQVAFDLHATSVNFKSIDNIVVKNELNNVFSPIEQMGSIDPEPKDFYGMGFAFFLPLKYRGLGNISFSLFSPLTYFARSYSGDPFLPEYVIYGSRYDRTTGHLSYAHLLSENWAISLGTHFGFQASADVEANSSISTGSEDPASNATSETKTKPSLAGIFSLSYRTIFERERSRVLSLSFHQGIKSNVLARAYGKTNLPELPYDINIETMVFFDPHILRLSISEFFSRQISFHATLEVQDWRSYQTPRVKVKQNSGVIVASEDLDQFDPRIIVIPKLGMRFSAGESWSFGIGSFFRPSSLKGDFSGPGNSLDADKWAFHFTPSFRFNFGKMEHQLSLALQYHHMKTGRVNKTPLTERSNPGQKIGAPFYDLGADILAASLGISSSF